MKNSDDVDALQFGEIDGQNHGLNSSLVLSITNQKRSKLAIIAIIASFCSLVLGLVLVWSLTAHLVDFDMPIESSTREFAIGAAAYLRGDSDRIESLKWGHISSELLLEKKVLDKPHQALMAHIFKKYRVAPTELRRIFSLAYAAASQTKLDPVLVLAVISIESNFNPILESPVGAQGLMQVMPKVHATRFQNYGGVQSVFQYAANIHVGSRILRDCIKQVDGYVDRGLQCYVGSNTLNEFTYSNKVLKERERFSRILAGDTDFWQNNNELELTPSKELKLFQIN